MLYFCRSSYYLTEFSSDWAKEARMSSQQLQFGKKVIDTKLGSRAAMHTHPFFEVGLDQPVSENQGDVLMEHWDGPVTSALRLKWIMQVTCVSFRLLIHMLPIMN